MIKETLDLPFSAGLNCGIGDRARYPLKFRPNVLITVPIVVADIKETKPQSTSTTAVFLCRPKV